MNSWPRLPGWSRTRIRPSSPEASRHTVHVSRVTFQQSDLRLPAFTVSPADQGGSALVAQNLALPGIKVDRVPGAPGDVAEVTEHRALLAFANLGAQLLPLANPIQEISEMNHVKVKQAFALALDLADDFIIQIVDRGLASGDGHAALLTVEIHAKA